MRPARPIWHWLVDPVDAVRDPERRRQMRLLNYLLIPVFAALILLSSWSGPASGYTLYFCANLIVILAIYALNRVGHYLMAASALSILVSASAFVNFLIRALYAAPVPEISLMRVMPAIIIAYLLLPLEWMVLLSVANVAGIVIVALLPHSAPYLFLTVTLYFTLIIMALMTIAAVTRKRHVGQIERQARELVESEERYRSLLEASFETIVVHRDGLIIDVNPAVERLVGYKPEEIIGKAATEFVEPPYHALMQAQYESGSTEPYEVLLRHKNGTVLHAEMRGKSQVYRGELVRVVAVRDITELKHKEELIVEREKVRVLQKFIGNLSHDLRTPLSVINTSIYLIDRLAREPDRQRHQIDVLQEQAEHMQRLLEDLISMSRLDKADTSDFKFRWININEPVTQAIRDHQNLALRKKQTLSYQLASDLPSVLLDVDQFKLAVKHLILNGLSYSNEGGTVSVETSCDKNCVFVRVSDNGVGIEPDDMPFIFEQFYRADPARGSDGGTGVGLSIARKIIEAHSGQIMVESQPGEGSVFTILLPIPPH